MSKRNVYHTQTEIKMKNISLMKKINKPAFNSNRALNCANCRMSPTTTPQDEENKSKKKKTIATTTHRNAHTKIQDALTTIK